MIYLTFDLKIISKSLFRDTFYYKKEDGWELIGNSFEPIWFEGDQLPSFLSLENVEKTWNEEETSEVISSNEETDEEYSYTFRFLFYKQIDL